MELLTIQHEDFTMYVECSKYEAIWEKAVRNVGRENLKPYNMGRMVFLDGNRQEVITGMLSVDVLYASELDRMMEKGWSFTASVSGNY